MDTHPDGSLCRSCDAALAPDDNFCRRCGVSAGEDARLPAVRGRADAVIWQPNVSPVVKGAAVMAVGTMGQFIVRRVIGKLIGGSRTRRRAAGTAVTVPGGMMDESQIITETFMLRRIRIRRQT